MRDNSYIHIVLPLSLASISKILSPSQIELYPIKQLPISSSLQPLATAVLLSGSLNLTTVDTSYKWNYTIICLFTTGLFCSLMGFPHSSVGEESAYNAGAPSSIPGLGRSPGEGIGYPLQYSWASLVAQLVKNPPAMQEAWVRSLGWEDPLEKGIATDSSILAWKIPGTIQAMGLQRVRHD